MFNLLKFRKPPKINCFFVTGTGRCGTMLVSTLLSLGDNVHCNHERSSLYQIIKDAYLTGNMSPLFKEIDASIRPMVKSYNRKSITYGESSGLLYLALKELHRRYGDDVRFILLIRKPDAFVRSALARGFFNPEHPHALEHLRALPTTEIGQNWATTTPFEKCLWYWDLVNGMVFDFFQTLPSEMWRIQPIETFDISSCGHLYEFLEIAGFDEKKQQIQEILSTRINATPNLGDDRHLNPWSLPMTTGEMSTWNSDELEIYERWTKRLLPILYPVSNNGI